MDSELLKINFSRLYAQLSKECDACRNFIICNPRVVGRSPHYETIYSSTAKLIKLLSPSFRKTIEELCLIAPTYDYLNIRANGIRSHLLITERCLENILKELKCFKTDWILRRSSTNLLKSYVNFLEQHALALELLKELPEFTKRCCLFPKESFSGLPTIGTVDKAEDIKDPTDVLKSNDDIDSEKLARFQSLELRFDFIKQEHFFSHCLAFYQSPNAQRVMNIIASFMVGYGQCSEDHTTRIGKLMSTVFKSLNSLLSPEERGRLFTKLTRNSSVHLCKAMWNCADHPIVRDTPSIVLPSLAVSHSFDLQPRTLFVPVWNKSRDGDTVSDSCCVSPPQVHTGLGPVSVRLVSYRRRPSMSWAKSTSTLFSLSQQQRPTDLGSSSSLSRLSQQMQRSRGSLCSLSSPDQLSPLPSPKPPLEQQSPSSNTPWLPRSMSTTSALIKGSTSSANSSSSKSSPYSPYLLFYIHGGGFVSLSSKSHDSVLTLFTNSSQLSQSFLRQWAKHLDCPIFCVDYTHSPEAPYPRALDEVYFAYSWAVLNLHRLGADCDARIVVCGDSAGGTLALSLCLKLQTASFQHLPVGLMIIYAPTVIAFTPSPSRMLSLMDPLLPIGIISKCLLAYAGVDESQLDQSSDDSTVGSQQLVTIPSPSLSTTATSLFNGLLNQAFGSTTDNSVAPITGVGKGVRSKSDSDDPSLALSDPINSASSYSTREGMRTSRLSDGGYRSNGVSPPSTNSSSSRISQIKFTIDDDDDSSNRQKPVFDDDEMLDSSQFVIVSNNADETGCDSSVGTSLEQRPANPNDDDLSTTLLTTSDLDRIRKCRIRQDALMSPYLASDQAYSRLPPMAVVSSQFDPFLDDCLEVAKRAHQAGVPVEVKIVKNLPHAFLNFSFLGAEFKQACLSCADMLKRLFEQRRQGSASDNDSVD